MKYRCRVCGEIFRDTPLATARESAFQHVRHLHPGLAPNNILSEWWQ